MHNSMRCQSSISPEEDDPAGPQLMESAALNRDHISRPDGRKHTESCNSQSCRTGNVNHFGEKIAAGLIVGFQGRHQ